MAKSILTTLAFLCSSIAASAQQSGSYIYAFGGPVVVPRSAFTRWDGNFLHVGGGGEGRLTDRFALGRRVGSPEATNQSIRCHDRPGFRDARLSFHPQGFESQDRSLC